MERFMKNQFGWRGGFLVSGFLVAGMAQAGPAAYEVGLIKVTVLGTLGGGDSSAYDVNNRGVIVGYSKNPHLERRAVRWQGGVIRDLGVPASSYRSIARGINDHGEIVGLYGDPDEFNYQAFYWSAGTGVITLNRSLYPDKPFDSSYVGMARAINDSGVIVGSVEASGLDGDVPYKRCYRSLPVRWETAYAMPKILHCSEAGDGPNSASGINREGTIAGYEYNGTSADNGFRWKNGATTHVPAPLFGTNPRMAGISDAGVLVGSADMTDTTTIAIRWSGTGGSEWLGTLPGGNTSRGTDVNSQGFITGTSQMLIQGGASPDEIQDRAFLFHSDFGMVALPVPPDMPALTTSCDGNALNDRVKTSGILYVVGRCGPRAIKWTVQVRMN
jgi:probable HAF family extracellular repeat protein